MRWLIGVVVACAVSGCASGPPTAKELAGADYGRQISQSEAESTAQAWLKTTLKDPSSAEIDWGSVGPGWARDGALTGGALTFGYKLDAQINARNSFGGRTGYKPYVFMFRNGSLVGVWGEQELHGRYGSSSYMGRLK